MVFDSHRRIGCVSDCVHTNGKHPRVAVATQWSKRKGWKDSRMLSIAFRQHVEGKVPGNGDGYGVPSNEVVVICKVKLVVEPLKTRGKA